jgi:hypothetical protein
VFELNPCFLPKISKKSTIGKDHKTIAKIVYRYRSSGRYPPSHISFGASMLHGFPSSRKAFDEIARCFGLVCMVTDLPQPDLEKLKQLQLHFHQSSILFQRTWHVGL